MSVCNVEYLSLSTFSSYRYSLHFKYTQQCQEFYFTTKMLLLTNYIAEYCTFKQMGISDFKSPHATQLVNSVGTGKT